MPSMAGDQFAAELRNIRPDIPIILCTGFSDKLTRQKVEELGISEALLKPIVKHKLAEKIRTLLNGRKTSPRREL